MTRHLNNQIKISIIVPVYNVAQYLNKCIDSIVSQTYREWELILIDDGSTDESGRICDEYAKVHDSITVIHKQNEGVSVARNIGLSHINGDWVTFVDSDDWLPEDSLSNMYEAAMTYDADEFIFGYTVYTENNLGEISEVEQKHLCYPTGTCLTVDEYIKESLQYHFHTHVWSRLFRSNCLKEVSFLVGLKIGEDDIFNFNVATQIHNDLVFIDTPVYNHLLNQSSVMHRKMPTRSIYQAKIQALNNLFIRKGLHDKYSRYLIGARFRNTIEGITRENDYPNKTERKQILSDYEVCKEMFPQYNKYVKLLSLGKGALWLLKYFRKK